MLSKIAVFADDEFGLQAIQLMKSRGKKVELLVYNTKTDPDLLEQIRGSGLCQRVISNDELLKNTVFNEVKSLGIDYIILAWWPDIIKKPIFKLAKQGILNMHPSYLPYNRGKHYYFWNFVEQVPYGVTLHLIDDNIDSGPISFQSRVETTWEDNAFSVREKGRRAMFQLFEDSLDDIFEGNIPRVPQDLSQGTFHYGNELKEASHIRLDKGYKACDLLNIIRGLSGFSKGGAWFQADGKRYEVNMQVREMKDD